MKNKITYGIIFLVPAIILIIINFLLFVDNKIDDTRPIYTTQPMNITNNDCNWDNREKCNTECKTDNDCAKAEDCSAYNKNEVSKIKAPKNDKQGNMAEYTPCSNHVSACVNNKCSLIANKFENKIVYTADANADTKPLETDCQSRKGVFHKCGSICENDNTPCVDVCAFTCESPSSF